MARLIQVTIAPDYHPEVIGEAPDRLAALALLGGWFLNHPGSAFMHPALYCSDCGHNISKPTDSCPCVVVDLPPVAVAIRESADAPVCPEHPNCNPLRHCPARDGA